MTDRVRARILSADGQTVLADSGENYVSDKNNERAGHMAFRAIGHAEFSQWSLKKDQ